VQVRRPEKGTRPKLFYKGAHQATLDPLAARRPEGGLYMWSEQPHGEQQVGSGEPLAWGGANSSAAAVLAYDVSHMAPWDWRVGLYTWTKSIAAGAYFVPLLLVLGGLVPSNGALWAWVAPVLAVLFLGLTGLILIWDLEHPFRFYLIFVRPQWRSWLVRGAVVITAYGAVLAVHFLFSLVGWQSARLWLALLGLPLSVMAAVYTGYLFAQAKARDLWQSPLLPPHLTVQAAVAGSAAILPFAAWLEPGAVVPLLWLLAAASLIHLLFVLGEATLAHPTAHAHVAAREMVRGRFARFFWGGVALVAVAIAAPALGPVVAVAALAGLLLHEHAYVQAGQVVPLA
jgi:formate-dependent nitrite reductase membrane component NrfD